MLKLVIGVLSLAIVAVPATPVAAQGNADKMKEMKAWRDCAQRVRKDYPVPPGNINTLNQMIADQCGPRP